MADSGNNRVLLWAMQAMTEGAEIRVRGQVQGVGFRPTVWQLATELGLGGEVLNDAEGVLIRLAGQPGEIDLLDRLRRDPPPLARIDAIRNHATAVGVEPGFHIRETIAGRPLTRSRRMPLSVPPARPVLDPFARRFRYRPQLHPLRPAPVGHHPEFLMPAPAPAWPHSPSARLPSGYDDPADRRFHAETSACHACGPRARLVRCDGAATAFDLFSNLDDCDAVCACCSAAISSPSRDWAATNWPATPPMPAR